MSVRNKIIANAYRTKEVYSKENAMNYRATQRILDEEFKRDALAETGLAEHKNAEKIYNKAWADGHAEGYLMVLQELEELADIIL